MTFPPQQPTRSPQSVVSVLSNEYSDLPHTDFDPDWGQNTDAQLDTNTSVLALNDFNYQGISLDPAITVDDLEDMDTLHIDLFSQNGLVSGDADQDANVLYFSLVQQNSQHRFKYLTITPGEVTTYNISLDDLNSSIDDTVIQLQFGKGAHFRGDISVANIYFYKTPVPPPPICFPKGTPVTTDQGEVAIEKLNTDKHTIRGKEIVAITQSRPLQKHIVCFEKDSLSKNVPSQQTLCSMEHKVFYKGEMIKARDLVGLCENVTFIDYNGETLYNVLLKKHDKMMINNLIFETLHPKNIMAKISTMKDGQKKNKAIQELTKIIKENNVSEYQKLYASLK